MKKQYILILHLCIMLFLLYKVVDYSYKDYRTSVSMAEIERENQVFAVRIKNAEIQLEQGSTIAYKNKVLKSEQGKKNPKEEVVVLISEERYKEFTQQGELIENENRTISSVIGDTQSLIDSMSIPERWIYLLFRKDIR